ncbi:unnamed protein product [Tilletia controversa]|nr:unnamed protein product [Tilletia controversa]
MLQFWSAFTASQRRNIAFYVLGIMCYKFALEYYNGAFITLANERFAKDKYQKIGILTGINYAAQGIGSILISPLIKRYPTRSVLSLAVLGFAIISAILLITDAATGGQPRTMRTDGKDFYGKYDPNLMFPIFALSGISYGMVELIRRIEHSQIVAAAPGYFIQIVSGLRAFAKAFYVGAYIIFSRRSLIWLVPSYTLALYGHRYLENVLAPIVAKQVLGVSSYSQIMVGGSNFGELCGSMSVMFFTNSVPTPMPWLRLDAVLLMLVWVLPYIKLETNNVASAWRLAGIFLPVSYGWAAGDVSLAAYIQSTLARMESTDRDVSALGAVMAFLYVLYIVIYALVSTFLGRWVDSQINGAVGAAAVGPAKKALVYVAGVHFTILAAIIIASTFIPRGALAFNPKPEGDLATPTDEEVEMARNGSEASDEYDLKEGISKRHGAKDDVTAGM